MKGRLILFFYFVCIGALYSQVSTATSGNYFDGSVWVGGSTPGAGTALVVNHPLTLSPTAGVLAPTAANTFNANLIDIPGDGNLWRFEPNAGTNAITIAAGVTVSFEGGTAGSPNDWRSGQIEIFGTLILGYTELRNAANLDITVHAGGTLIINGDLENKNNSGDFVVNGALIVNGTFNNSTGSVTVGGSGTIDTTGGLISNGGSTIFGTTNDCSTGPCSGSTLACTFDNYVSPSSATVCSGTSTVTFTSNPVAGPNSPTSPSYQWKSSTDNITFTNVGTNSATYTTPILTQTTYVKVTITATGPSCTSTSATAKITVLGTGGWKGTTSSWSTASNWCGNAVPTALTDVTITNGAGIPNMPIIAAGTAALCNNLVISNTFPSSTLTLASGASSLSISGNLTNNGTITDGSTALASNGIKLVGTSSQTLSGTYSPAIKNLTINNTSGLIPAVTISSYSPSVSSFLTMTAGVVNLNSFNLTLGASVASPGTLFYGGGWFYNGNFTRYFPTAATTIGTVGGHFPVGSALDYRPMFIGMGTTLGGTYRVGHIGVYPASSTALAPPYAGNGGTVAVRSDSYWIVGNTFSNGTHGIRTLGTGFGTVGAVTDVGFSLVNSAAPGTHVTGAGSTTNPQVERSGLTAAQARNNFYWGSINAVNTPLPISLVSFSGSFIEQGVSLEWVTASQENFDRFVIERAVDGINFTAIGEVPGEAFSVKNIFYNFIDEEVKTGKYYYRLKNVDRDETFDYSEIVVVSRSVPFSISLYPNPVRFSELLNLSVISEQGSPIQFQLVSPLGAIIREWETSLLESMIPTSELSLGLYLLRTSNGKSSTTTKFVVIN